MYGKRFFFLQIFFLFFGCFFGFASQINAQVIINEVMPAPSQGDEWVELKNITDQTISLNGWSVEDNTGALTPTPVFSSSNVPGQSYFVFEVKNRLNNSGDLVLLRKPDLTQADFFQYSTSTTDVSWARVGDTTNNFVQSVPSRGLANPIPSPSPSASPSATPISSPASSPVPTPSPTPQPIPVLSPFPTVSSPTPTPVPLASLPLQLSEVVACPETSQPEWVEFFNPNSILVSISNWKLKDSSGNTRVINLNLPAQSYASFDLSSAIFNNDGDTLAILDADGDALIELELPACVKGQSVVYVNGSWQLTNVVTKSNQNTFSPNEIDTSPSPQPLNLEALRTTAAASTYSAYPLDSYEYSSPVQNSLSVEEPKVSEDVIAPSSTESAENFQTPPETGAGSVLGQTIESSPSPSSSEELNQGVPFYSRKNFLISLFVLSSLALAVGGFGVYQWYTERRAEEALEIL